ncbi:MAG: hypothetical protein NZ853_03030 [Leptospiraceae bacterium]|nr:hypothetical protein [Leptospiraceae bacterium]MDW7975148.1 hypothetical protein [Leptospiraceae bacterium]
MSSLKTIEEFFYHSFLKQKVIILTEYKLLKELIELKNEIPYLGFYIQPISKNENMIVITKII